MGLLLDQHQLLDYLLEREKRELSSRGDQLVSVVAVWCGLTPTLTTTEKEEEDCYLGSVRAP